MNEVRSETGLAHMAITFPGCYNYVQLKQNIKNYKVQKPNYKCKIYKTYF